MVCGLSQVSLATCNKLLTLRGKKRLVVDCFCYATEPVNLSTLTSSKPANAHQRKFTPILFNIKSQFGRSRPEFARLY